MGKLDFDLVKGNIIIFDFLFIFRFHKNLRRLLPCHRKKKYFRVTVKILRGPPTS